MPGLINGGLISGLFFGIHLNSVSLIQSRLLQLLIHFLKSIFAPFRDWWNEISNEAGLNYRNFKLQSYLISVFNFITVIIIINLRLQLMFGLMNSGLAREFIQTNQTETELAAILIKSVMFLFISRFKFHQSNLVSFN